MSALASGGGACDGAGMSEPRKSGAQAGGFLIAAAILVGAVGGIVVGEPSAGFLAGLAVGVAAALLLWWRDRARP